MSNEKIDVLNELRKFQRSYMMSDLHEEAEAMGGIFSAVSELIEAADHSLSQTRANQSAGLVPTIYYSAHQRLISALDRVRSS